VEERDHVSLARIVHLMFATSNIILFRLHNEFQSIQIFYCNTKRLNILFKYLRAISWIKVPSIVIANSLDKKCDHGQQTRYR